MAFKMKEVGIGILVRSEKYFLARRSGRDYHGCWEFPGGRYEENEAWADTVVRKWEELKVKVEPRFAFYDETFVDLNGVRFNAIAGWVDCQDGEPTIGLHHSESRWMTPEEILLLISTTPTTKPILISILRDSFIRASGDTPCRCGKPYRKHPDDSGLIGWQDLPFLKILCDGTRVKL